MAATRTGTGAWKRVRDTMINKGRAHDTPCADCRQPLDYRTHGQPNSPEVDHITPVKHGGTDHPDNLQLLCRTCNRSKGSKVQRNQPTTNGNQAEQFPHTRAW